MSRLKTSALAARLVAAIAAASFAAWADTLTWKGAATGTFSTPSNWTSADEGGTSTYGPRPGDTVKFAKIVGLTEETFDIGSAGLTIDNSKYVTNYVKFVGSGKIVKKGSASFDIRTLSTHTGGSRLEQGLFVFYNRNIKTFGTGAIEVVRDGTSNSRSLLQFSDWASGLTNEVRVVDAGGSYAPLYCHNPATVSGPIYSDGDFRISSGYGSFTISGPINAHGHTVTIQCDSGRNPTVVRNAIDASLTKTGDYVLQISGVSTGLDDVLTVNAGTCTVTTAGIWGGTNVVASGLNTRLQLTAGSNFSTPPVISLSNGAIIEMQGVAVVARELWIDGVRQDDGTYTAADLPGSIVGVGGRLLVGAQGVATKIWTGGSSGLLSNGSNWSDGQSPATGDILMFLKNVNLEAESTDIGAGGMELYVAKSCVVTNNNAFTGSGLLTKSGAGTLRENVVLGTTGGIKVIDGSIELMVRDTSSLGSGTIELDTTGGTTPKLFGKFWNEVVTNHVKITGQPVKNVIEQENLMNLTRGIESDGDFVCFGFYGPLHISGGISAPGKTMTYVINGRHVNSKVSQLGGTVDCSLVVSNYNNSFVGIMEMSGNSPCATNSFTMLCCTNRLTETAYWGGTNIVVRRAEAKVPAHLILNGAGNLNPEATLTLENGGTVEVAAGKKVCIAHLVTDGVRRRDSVYTSGNLPGYVLGAGRLQVGNPGQTIIFR